MNMKTYKIITLAFIAMISFNSCSDFLTTELTDKKASDTYYKTPAEAYTALVGCYNGLDLLWNTGTAFPVSSEVLSDNCFGGTGSSDKYEYQMMDEFNPSVSPATNSVYSDNWKYYYQAIYRCNVLLSKLDQVAWDSTTISLKKQYKAEAKFIRAFCYFDMVRMWEKVPLVIVPTLDNVPQAEPAVTYAQIMSDLRYASDSLQSAVYTSVPSGRVTKWAAESLLARVYLFYSGYYGQATIGGETATTALAAVEDVIKNSGHDLVPDFNTLWPAASIGKSVTYAGENNQEVVFSIKYSSAEDFNGNITGNEWMVMEGIRGSSHYPYQYGWGACTVDPKLYNTFTSKDSRQFASIIAITEEKIANTAADIAGSREYTGYFMKKYSPLCDKKGISIVTNFMIGQYQDYFSIRYADVLLMAAELGSTNKQAYLDAVCKRAGVATGLAPTKANILAQRQLEFVGEGIRYWDLLRQGIATAASTIANNTTLSYLNDGHTAPTAAQLQANITTTRGFQQIPNDQITLSSGVLKQNAGW
jgi:starch-binding outer membrane protein, SusD/RagB family